MILKGTYINLIVASSNVAGLIFWPRNAHGMLKVTLGTMIGASTLMHLAERKHQLPGIVPFNRYANAFLWCDRIMAYLSSAIVVYHLYHNSYSRQIYVEGIFGLVNLFLSEVVFKRHWIGFTITHSIWHILAYKSFYNITSISQ